MGWTVTITKKVAKAINGLPARVKQTLALLMKEIEAYGPVRSNWPNYSKLGKNQHHCHLKKGKPTYVAVWELRDGKAKLVEVTYVGTHEKAPY